MAEHNREQRKLARQLRPALNKLHQRAEALSDALNQVQDSSKGWQHFLLQPPFAQDAANLLDETFDRPYALAAALYAHLDYCDTTESGDARNTLQIPGLLCVSRSVIAQAESLNREKAVFFQLVNDFKASFAERPVAERDRQLREAMANAGFPRTHLRQAYRQVLLCPIQPQAIALSWVKARKSIRKVSVEWCEKKLIQLDPTGTDSGIQYQRQLLAGLHKSQHQELRQVQTQSRPNLQVAEIFRGQKYEQSTENNSGKTYRQLEEHYRQVGYSAMPVLVAENNNKDGKLPDFTRVDHQPSNAQRRQRKDLALSKEPLLPALRVFVRTSYR